MFTQKIKVRLKRFMGAFTHVEVGLCGYVPQLKACCDKASIAVDSRIGMPHSIVTFNLGCNGCKLEHELFVVVYKLGSNEQLANSFNHNDSPHIVETTNRSLKNKWQQSIDYVKLLHSKILGVYELENSATNCDLSKCLRFKVNDRVSLSRAESGYVIVRNDDGFEVSCNKSQSLQVLGSPRAYNEIFLDDEVNEQLFNCHLDFRVFSAIKKRGEDVLQIIRAEFTVMSINNAKRCM